MSKNEIVWVPQGTNEKIEALARKLGKRKGRSPRSPGGRLLVIERKLDVLGNSKQELWMQIIFNPWEFEEYEPIIDLLNVDSRRLPGFSLINDTEGRFRWDNRSKWRRGDKANLYAWFEDILNSDIIMQRLESKRAQTPLSHKRVCGFLTASKFLRSD